MSLVASNLNIPGLYLLHDFVSTKEEEVRNYCLLYLAYALFSLLILSFESFELNVA